MDTSTALEGSPPSSPSSSSSSSSPYDVFLSFSGEDTRKTFTDHLYWTMKDSGIDFFMEDNESTRRGENLSDKVKQIIVGSRVSVIVFSSRYADSIWCLEELVQIMECRRTLKQIVLPIFYDLSPSDAVGTFAQAFQKHRKRFHKDTDKEEKIQRWTDAFTEAADLTTWVFRTTNGYEGMFIRKIIDEITRRLKSPIPIGTGFSELQEIDSPVIKLEDGHSSMPDWGAVLPTEPFTSRTFSDSGEDHGSKIRQQPCSGAPCCLRSLDSRSCLDSNKQQQQQQQHRMILLPNSNNNGANPSDGKTERKIVRRDIERQRRQLMAALYASLRSVLPFELIKGKRSITEHINEAINYINHMKAKIEELNAKKEKINKKLYECDSQDFGLRNESSGHNFLKYSVMVRPTCLGGVAVLVSSSCGEEEGLLLSGVLKVLLAEDLSVVGCASTRVNESLFHTIQCEVVNDLACLDLSELQLKLINYCNSG